MASSLPPGVRFKIIEFSNLKFLPKSSRILSFSGPKNIEPELATSAYEFGSTKRRSSVLL